LTPNDSLSVRIHVQVLFQELPWERVELFNTGEGGVFDVVVGTVLAEGGPNLSGAENYTLDVLGVVDSFAVFRIGDDPFELRVTSEFING
jgi:hypothetical protein